MATTNFESLLQLLSEAIGDHFTFATTTDLTTDKKVISSTLNQFDRAQDGFFDDYWVYLDGTNNAAVLRKLGSTTYDSTNYTLYVWGANLKADTGNTTCYLHRFNRDNKKRALNRAIEQVPLFRRLEDRTLVTGNVLPDNSFEMWTASDASSFYSTSSVTLTRTTTAGLIRGMMGTTSMKVTNGGSSDGYAYLSSHDYPRLLDLQGKTVTLKCWARPDDNDDDAQIEIWTSKETSTGVITQTLTSDTASYEDRWGLLKLENQTLNDDLDEIQLRFKVVTANADVYYDTSSVVGMGLYEYLLLSDFEAGEVLQVSVQTTGDSDDSNPRDWERVEFRTIHDGTYLYLRLKRLYPNNRQIRVIGITPLESLSSDSDTISVSGEVLNLIIAKAAAILYRLEQGPVSSEDKGRYYNEINMWEGEYRKLLPSLMMTKPSSTLYTG